MDRPIILTGVPRADFNALDVKVGELVVNVKSFGATGNGTTDDTSAIQSAIDYATTNNCKKVYYPKGTYKIDGTITVSGLSAFDMCFVGDGRGRDGRGVSLVKANAGYIIDVDLTYASGVWRGFSLYDITLRGSEAKLANGIKMVYCQLSRFYNVEFLQLNKGAVLTGNSHYPRFEGCHFYSCTKGIYLPPSGDADYVAGGSNGGTLSQSFFTNTTTPIEMLGGGSWGFSNTDFEGDNGQMVISGKNIFDNIRIERNLNDTRWVKILGDYNKLDCRVYSAGGNTPRCIFEIAGNYNEIELRGSGITILDDTTTGEYNSILIHSYNRLSDGVLFSGEYPATNTIQPNLQNPKSNLIPFSKDVTQWAVEGGSANITYSTATHLFTVAKSSAEDLLLSQTIAGTFPAETVFYFMCEKTKVITGGGWYVRFNDGTKTVTLNLVPTTDNKLIGWLKTTVEVTDPKIEIRCTGGSGSAITTGGFAVQTTWGGYFETKETADKEDNTAYAAPPVNGYYKVGDVVYNSAPSASSYLGWVCVTAGIPGTWKGFGLIEA